MPSAVATASKICPIPGSRSARRGDGAPAQESGFMSSAARNGIWNIDPVKMERVFILPEIAGVKSNRVKHM